MFKGNRRTLGDIEERFVNFVADQEFYVLRDAKTGMAYNVSYTEEGLKWSTSSTGKLVYFRNAKLKPRFDKDYKLVAVDFTGDLRMSNRVVVEKFVPTNQTTNTAQKAEYTWTSKGYRLALLNASPFEAENET